MSARRQRPQLLNGSALKDRGQIFFRLLACCVTHCSSSPFGVPGHRAPSHGRAESHVNISVAMVFEAFYKTAMSVRAGAPARAATASAPASSPRFAPTTTAPPPPSPHTHPAPSSRRAARACTWASSSRVLSWARRCAVVPPAPRRRARSPPRRAARARAPPVAGRRSSLAARRGSPFLGLSPPRVRARARAFATPRAAGPRAPRRRDHPRVSRAVANPAGSLDLARSRRGSPTAMAPDEKKRSAHSWPPRVRRVSEENKQPEPPPLVRSFD